MERRIKEVSKLRLRRRDSQAYVLGVQQAGVQNKSEEGMRGDTVRANSLFEWLELCDNTGKRRLKLSMDIGGLHRGYMTSAKRSQEPRVPLLIERYDQDADIVEEQEGNRGTFGNRGTEHET
ncbi:hypothetical protein R1sor_010279 [Riccia sorocarpa]|uniref:Uncharacterized protein n=1 Tax=Riccia sorocarpa TaxID=122646 RepID=A0ABD3HXT3_9MARC